MLTYPDFLKPTDIEVFSLENTTIAIPKCIIAFEKWSGSPIKNTFGGKPVVCVNNQPMFAELAIMTYFISEGWDSRWIETYGKSNKEPIYLSNWKDDKYKNQEHTPIRNERILKLLNGIAIHNDNSFSGCWDVLAWHNENIIFAESKRTKKDKIRQTQVNWLNAGLKSGLNSNNFLVIQWDLE